MRPGKQFALDTDWLTAVSMLALFVICLFFAAGNGWLLARGSFQASRSPFAASAFAAYFLWMAYKLPEKTFKIAAFMLAIGPLIKVVLWVFRATPETVRFNAGFGIVLDIIASLGACVFVVKWFRSRFRYMNAAAGTHIGDASETRLGQ